MEMGNINGMRYDELIGLRNKVHVRLKEFNPVRLRRKWKRCGHKNCQCCSGPSDGSEGNLHGPYVYAQFMDNDLGKIRNISLGRYYDEYDLSDIVEKSLNFSDYFKVDPGELEKMTASEKEEYYFTFYLDDAAFEKHHGITREEDTMRRYDHFFGNLADRDAYESAARNLEEHRLAVTHKWATDYGIGSIKGQMVLRRLLAGKYYLKA